MGKRKSAIVGLIVAAAIAVVPFCTDYGNDGWRIWGWHTGIRSSEPPKVKSIHRYSDSTNERLRFLGFEAHESPAIYELGRRGAREFEPQIRKAAEAPPWVMLSKDQKFRRARDYDCKVAALAVLAKWQIAGAEYDLLKGAALFADMENYFVPALAYVNSTQTVARLKTFKDYRRGTWKCSLTGKHELDCTWIGLQF